ncbi:lipopolysaccharide biosynthesis protein [Christiangramia sp. SM2212]|uniref:Lipopolysaccharide biosynthesis protein n=1 Tax=Christiangramia sediminicola TaxID=3073267 RepID=A0ABU1ERC1_9FLAO|nr:lipopolysaccharide biosynthesis protein [Christiangramia sp. SM2212]MDR5590582.1 lipopolysaccharide biosynthesis protein [Christiangramia sp. SM2212]
MSLRKQATLGLVWTFSQQFGTQLISFIVSLFLARILLPAEFGLIGMIAVFISIGKALVDSGLTQSIIRSKKLDQEDYSTVFFFNLAASFLIYLIIFFIAPFIADFYNQSILVDILRLYCITFIISAFSAVQLARLTQRMDFKTQTIIAIPSILIGGIVGITMAYSGYGVWSLVWNQIITALVSSIQIWIYSKWTPSFTFSLRKFKDHFNFGYKLTISSLLDRIFSNLYIIVIGKFFAPSQVGFYTRAETMKQLPVSNISMALNKVTYPLFSTIQDDNVRLKKVYKKLMRMVVFVIAPVLMILAALAEPLFRFLFTEKWLPAVPYFQILCLSGILYPVHMYNLNVLKVKGRSDLFLKLAIIKKVLVVILVVIGLQFGIYGILWSQVIMSCVAFIINSFYTNKFINYSAFEQIKDLIPIFLVSGLIGISVYLVDSYLQFSLDIARILVWGTTGTTLYLIICHVLNFEGTHEIKNIVKNVIEK